jgi:hypothetical protein
MVLPVLYIIVILNPFFPGPVVPTLFQVFLPIFSNQIHMDRHVNGILQSEIGLMAQY